MAINLDKDKNNPEAFDTAVQRATEKPEYKGTFDDQLRDIYDKITNRQPFSYDVGSDPMYRMYADKYMQQGKAAMRDTMGQAAALTGGYGNSYAQNVGQQAYDAALQKMGDVIPEFYGMALDQYNAEGDALTKQYGMLGDLAADEYGKYRDQMSDWNNAQALERQQEQDAASNRQQAYSNLYALIKASGYSPTDDELTAAGMTREAAEALIKEYLRSTGQLAADAGSGSSGGSGGGGSRGSSAGGSGTKNSDTNGATANKSTAKDNTGAARAALQAVNAYQKGTMSMQEATAKIQDLYDRGLITSSTVQRYASLMRQSARPGANR